MIGCPLCLLSALVFVGAPSGFGQSNTVALASPDQQIVLRFTVKPRQSDSATNNLQDGQLVYSLAYRGKEAFESSALSLELENQPPLGSEVHIASAHSDTGMDAYKLVAGKTSSVHDSYNAVTLELKEGADPGRTFEIEARAYNSGIAFRYHVPEQAGLSRYKLVQEDTEFRPVMDASAWALRLPNYQSGYESEYVPQVLSALSNQGGVSSYILNGSSMLMEMPGVAWAAVGEADLEGNAAMYLENPTGNWTGHFLVSKISPPMDGKGPAVDASLPHDSAWRIILLGDTPGKLVESNLFTDLNPPNRITDTSWIIPGKASWNWWNGDLGPDGKSAYTTKNMEYYVDFAAASGFPYMMLDAGWSGSDITKLRGNVDVPELVQYAAQKHVKIWIWLYSKAVAAQMQEAFPLYEKWGVAGVKIDFILRNDQAGIQWYYNVAKLAAEHHLMVDFHGATQPWGIQRTYPNVLNYEAVLGLENNKAGRRDGPLNRVTFPFTRMLSGPMDYTPGGFDNVTPQAFVARDQAPMVMGTRAQQLALYVVFEEPLAMVSDVPSAYAGQPEFQFIKEVPTTWDETRVLDGLPGEYVTIARRQGKDWYLGSLTNWTPRELHVPLNFLGTGRYKAELYEDAADADHEPKHVTMRQQTVQSGDTLTLRLASGGGCAIRFVPLP
ncbi:glycoside hydrolase family 97 protein [Silvibacterium dinghuense]|uniref:Glycoside hydrolase family 97 protein n=1 Tax=Silvibacterium dinghuense TaxID=1560006 RepID=A0A4Q1SBA5_9BACT|nr:glycoside hydrolase family 97 protein [Silvibacterium dinghuense]RXS94289.1 glycoside hydrolase family 97 protein [Silvibacterium dinghuense]